MYVCSLLGGRGLIIEANIPVQELRVKKGRGLIFEGGLFSGGYGTCKYAINALAAR